jgi:hypothetical protein
MHYRLLTKPNFTGQINLLCSLNRTKLKTSELFADSNSESFRVRTTSEIKLMLLESRGGFVSYQFLLNHLDTNFTYAREYIIVCPKELCWRLVETLALHDRTRRLLEKIFAVSKV